MANIMPSMPVDSEVNTTSGVNRARTPPFASTSAMKAHWGRLHCSCMLTRSSPLIWPANTMLATMASAANGTASPRSLWSWRHCAATPVASIANSRAIPSPKIPRTR